LTLRFVALLGAAKFASWAVSLGSGTAGGTLAPVFTIGGTLGALLAGAAARLLPAAGIDPGMAALVGMVATFAGASRALLTSVVYDDGPRREAAEHMVNHDVGRLPVISRPEPWKVVGMVTRSDLLAAHRRRRDVGRPGS